MITLRRNTNRPLTWDEMDNNFVDLDGRIVSLRETSSRYAFETLADAQAFWDGLTPEEQAPLDNVSFVVVGDGEYLWGTWESLFTFSEEDKQAILDEIQSLQDTTARYAFDTLQEAQDKWASFSQEERDALEGKTFVVVDENAEYKWDSAQSGGTHFVRNFDINLKNKLSNSDFSDGTNSWSFDENITQYSVDANILTFTGGGSTNTIGNRISQTTLPTNSVIYARVIAKGTIGNETLHVGRGNTGDPTSFSLSNDFKPYSMTSSYASSRFAFGGGAGDSVQVKEIVALDLTAIFGVGKEPDAQTVDLLLKNSGGEIWFEELQINLLDLLKITSNTAESNISKAAHGYPEGESPKTLKEVEEQSAIRLANIFNDGSFINGLDNLRITANITDANVVDNILSFTGAGSISNTSNYIYQTQDTDDDLPNEDKAYIRIVAKADTTGTLYIGRGNSAPAAASLELTENFASYSAISDFPSARIKFGASLGDLVYVESIMVLNLTKVFGAGKEPTAEQMDLIIQERNGWFSGSVDVSIKLLNNLYLRLIEENRIDVEDAKNTSEFTLTRSLKVLLIGSSFGMDAIMHFPILANKAGVDIKAANLYKGGVDITEVRDMCINNSDFQFYSTNETGLQWSRLTSGTENRTVLKAITDDEWDIIILQRGAHESNTWTNDQRDALFFVMDYIKENVSYNPKIMFNTCHSFPIDTSTGFTRQDQIDRTNLINSTAQQMQLDAYVDIIPMATAIQNARSTILTNYGTWADNDLARDVIHLDPGVGNYVAGCLMFEKLIGERFGLSIRNLDYIPVLADVVGLHGNEATFTPITEDMAKVAKLAAIAAIIKPFEVSENLSINFPPI